MLEVAGVALSYGSALLADMAMGAWGVRVWWRVGGARLEGLALPGCCWAAAFRSCRSAVPAGAATLLLILLL